MSHLMDNSAPRKAPLTNTSNLCFGSAYASLDLALHPPCEPAREPEEPPAYIYTFLRATLFYVINMEACA